MQGKEQIGYEEHIRRFKQRSVCAAGEIEILEVEDGEKRSDPDIAGAYQHIQNQITDGGWERMVRAGIARDNIYEKLAFRADAEKQIQAYEMAIKALENSEAEEWVDRCYLGSPCPYQHN